MNDGEPRELTREERAAIKKLVVALCANYDRDYGCLPLGCVCYMFGKWWTGGCCNYFRGAALPLDPVLEAALIGGADVEIRLCALCGAPYPANGRKAYCSVACAGKAQRKQQREHMRKKRDRS